MQDYERLRNLLPRNAQLVLGNVSDTVKSFLDALSPESPIGYVVLDVDYYSSSLECLKIFEGDAGLYLPETLMYLDDINADVHNPWQGELLAVHEFNEMHSMRKICPYNFLRSARVLKNAMWIDQIYLLHVLDHASKSTPKVGPSVIQGNPYLKIPTVG